MALIYPKLTVYLIAFLTRVSGFNIDLQTHVMHSSPQAGSMFGFTVSLYKYGGLNTLLVGAPKFQTAQPGVFQGGAVLNCSSESSDVGCTYVPFDIAGNSVHNLGFAVDNKTNQFFGATLKTSRDKGIVVACAPKYVWFTESVKRREPVGSCYVARNGLTDFQEFSPCRTKKWGYHRQGSCQAGFDAALSSDGDRMYIGAPGAFYWQGQAWATYLRGQIHSQSLIVRNEYFTTGEGPATDDDQYMGYSVTAGEFTGDGIPDVALGVPKGLNYTGKDKVLTEFKLTNQGSAKSVPRLDELNRFYEGFSNSLCSNKSQLAPRLDFQEDCQLGYSKTSLPELAQLRLDSSAYGAYSMAVGQFHEYPGEELVIGIPRGQNARGELIGKLALYSHDLRWLQNVTGDQLGSYFGYCLGVTDFNGDGLDDIIVGAPLYTDFEDREMRIEVGKVHILLQNPTHQFSKHLEYLGTMSRGRFGLSVASLGDVNLDGFGDFAVGAPYSGADGRGAVFIFHGFSTSEREIVKSEMKKPAQIIHPSEVGSSFFTTFGWSLSGGVDMDNNQYPDLLVGAYESEKVFLFKSRPIIKFLEHRLELKSEGKTIDLKQSTCKVRRMEHTCLDLLFCLSFTGVNVDGRMELDVEYRLDTKQNTEQRLFFKANDQTILREKLVYRKETLNCQTHKTYVKNGLVDKLTPLAANVSYSLIRDTRSTRSLTPVLNVDQRLSLQDSVTIQKNCGKDNICTPDLMLKFEAPDDFTIGSPGMLNVSVLVENKGEDAFESTVLISEPQGLLFKRFEPKETTSCSTRKLEGSNFLKCDIGNPLASQQTVAFHVLFQQSGPLRKPQFEFLVTANSTNAERSVTTGDNFVHKVVKAKIDAELSLFGSSEPDIIIYNTSLYQVPVRKHESHFGPSLMHKYGLVNKGFAEIEDVEVYILWPTRTLSGNHLLYMLEQPITLGNIKCDTVPDVNPMSLTLISDEERERQLGMTSLEKKDSLDDLSEVTLDRERGSFFKTSSPSMKTSPSFKEETSFSTRRGQSITGRTSASPRAGTSFTDGRLINGSTSGSSRTVGERTYTNYSSATRRTEGAAGGQSASSSISGSHYYSLPSESDVYSSSRSGTDGRIETSGRRVDGLHSTRGGHTADGVERGILTSSSSGSGSEGDFARTLHAGSQGGLTSTMYSPSLVGHKDSGTTHRLSVSRVDSYPPDGTAARKDSTSTRGETYDSSQAAGGFGRYYVSQERSTKQQTSSSSSSTSFTDGFTPSQGTSYSKSSTSYFDKSRPTDVSSSSFYHKETSSSSYPNQWNEIEKRKRRSVDDEFARMVSDCGTTICTRIHCKTGRLAPNDDAYVYIRSSLFIDTLKDFTFPVDDLTITTKMITKAKVMSYGLDEQYVKVASKNITTPIRSAKSLGEAPPVPWWVILLATLAGILILLVIILILWRCGYFKRQRPRHQAQIADDSRPLNPSSNGTKSTNGIKKTPHRTPRTLYPGDEAL